MSAVNYRRTARGLVAAVCRFCSREARPVRPNHCNEPDLFAMARGWSEAPYPAEHRHPDGSQGSFYSCPVCNARLRAGQRLRLRAEPKLTRAEALR